MRRSHCAAARCAIIVAFMVVGGVSKQHGVDVVVLGQNPTVVALSQADDFNDPGADCRDPEYGNISEMVEVDSPDIDKAGTYKITYKCTNPKGLSESATRTLIVKKTVAAGETGPSPKAHVNGKNPLKLSIAMLKSYKDKGVTCIDPK